MKKNAHHVKMRMEKKRNVTLVMKGILFQKKLMYILVQNAQ